MSALGRTDHAVRDRSNGKGVSDQTMNLCFHLMSGDSPGDLACYGGVGGIVGSSSDDGDLGLWDYLWSLTVNGKPRKLRSKGTWSCYESDQRRCSEIGRLPVKQAG